MRGVCDAGTTGNFEVTLRRYAAEGSDRLGPAGEGTELAFSKQRGDSVSGFPDTACALGDLAARIEALTVRS